MPFHDYYTFTATGEHLQFEIPVGRSSGNTFLDLSALMVVALMAGVFLIIGITLLAIYLKPRPEDLVGWTRPEPLKQAEIDPLTVETNEPLTVEDLPSGSKHDDSP